MLPFKANHNIAEVVNFLDNLRFTPKKLRRWADTTQKREQKNAQRAIRNRGRGEFNWSTPLYRTGLLYSKVNDSHRLTSVGNALHTLTLNTPVFYAERLTERFPYLTMSQEEVTEHVNELSSLIFGDRARSRGNR